MKQLFRSFLFFLLLGCSQTDFSDFPFLPPVIGNWERVQTFGEVWRTSHTALGRLRTMDLLLSVIRRAQMEILVVRTEQEAIIF